MFPQTTVQAFSVEPMSYATCSRFHDASSSLRSCYSPAQAFAADGTKTHSNDGEKSASYRCSRESRHWKAMRVGQVRARLAKSRVAIGLARL